MIGDLRRISILAALAAGLAACSSGPAEQPRTAAPASQSGTMNHSGMGQMDQAQMMQHCRAMMQGGGMAHGGGAANSGGMGQMDHAQMMQHCRAMMQGEGGAEPDR
ncbi:23S rRNA U2552 (ribose-2'-O)-methylase RlmE/FtsJ [Skermanella aerolata]|jgi:23S rRNA U2552 (ribose-2'-O)-methylase RlmE/FtsJ|uniref:hypothetical protein n=1 Tax=Skermanella aerolata TaxID=393310 RepID=UPI003D1B5E88